MTRSAISSRDTTMTSDTSSPAIRWILAIVLFVVVVVGFFDRISIAVLFTNADFQSAMGTGFDPTKLGLLMTSFLIAYGASSLLLSMIGDLWGPRKSLAAAASIWGGLMGLMGASSSFTSMLWCRTLLGVAEGPQFSLMNTLVKRWFPSKEQARASSIWLVGSPLGSAFGFPLAIFLVAAYGWRMSFFVIAALNLLLVVPLVLMFVKDWPPGAAHEHQTRHKNMAEFMADVGLIFRDWKFWMVTICQSGGLVYLWGLNSWLPTYLTNVRHFDLRQLGIFASLPFVAMFIGQLGGAYISDKLGRRAIVCFIGLAGAGLMMYLASATVDPHLAAIYLALSAGCWGVFPPAIFALAIQIIPKRATSTGIGVCNGIGNLIGACAPLVMGALMARFGNFEAGLMVLVGAGAIGACAMVPLMSSDRIKE